MNNIYNAIQNLYNMDKTTWQEVLAELYNLVSNIENKFDLFEVKFGPLLGEQVTRELKKMYDDGSLASLINDMLLKDINKKVDTFKTEVNEQLDTIESDVKENYAKKDDVVKISSGTPLFAPTTTEMIDTTRNYVNTTDGYLYNYSGGQWIKTTVLYQATGVQTTSKSYSLNSKSEIVKDNKYIQQIGNLATYTNSEYIKFDCVNLSKVVYGRDKAFVDGEGIGIYDTNLQKIGYVSTFNLIKTESGYYYYLIDLSSYTNAKYILTTKRFGDLWAINYKFYDYYQFYNDGITQVDNKIIIDEIAREKIKTLEIGHIDKSTVNYSDYLLNSKATTVNDSYIQQEGNIVSNTSSVYIKFDCSNLKKVVYARTKEFVSGEGIGIYNSELSKIGYVSTFNLLKSENGWYYYLIDLTNYSNVNYILTTKQYSTIWAVNYKFYDYYNFYETKSISTLLNCSLADIELRKKIKNIEEELNGTIANHILKGKKWTIISDSLSDETNVLPNRKYPTMIEELIGVNVQNLSHAGFGWKNGDNYFVEIAKSLATDSDILTFMGSINDKNYTLGTATDKTTDTIGGCINLAIDNAYNKNLGIKIGLISPIPSGSTNIPSNTDCFLYKLTVLMEEVAKLRSVPFLDLFRSSNIRTNNSSFVSKYMLDDTHLNELGHEKFMVNRILDFISSI